MMKDEELAELDLAVARAEGLTVDPKLELQFGVRIQQLFSLEHSAEVKSRWLEYKPTRDGAEAMRLLEKYGLTVGKLVGPLPDEWLAYRNDGTPQDGRGPTSAIAICRAVVALAGSRP